MNRNNNRCRVQRLLEQTILCYCNYFQYGGSYSNLKYTSSLSVIVDDRTLEYKSHENTNPIESRIEVLYLALNDLESKKIVSESNTSMNDRQNSDNFNHIHDFRFLEYLKQNIHMPVCITNDNNYVGHEELVIYLVSGYLETGDIKCVSVGDNINIRINIPRNYIQQFIPVIETLVMSLGRPSVITRIS